MSGINIVWGFKYKKGSTCIYNVVHEAYLKRPTIIKDNIPGFNFIQREVSKLNGMSTEEYESLRKDFFLCMFKRELVDGLRTGTFYILPAEGRKSWRYILPQSAVLEPLKIDKLIGKFYPN